MRAAWDDDVDVLEVEADEGVEDGDTTAEQAASGRDYQGIPWENLPWTRESYREDRLNAYRNYVNCPESTENLRQLSEESVKADKGSHFYDFRLNTRSVRSIIVHFQLRNLVWATSKHDVYLTSETTMTHWNPITRRKTVVMDLERGQQRGKVQISTMCAHDDLLVAGGFNGEMVVRSVKQPGLLFNQRLTTDENAITNALEVSETRSGARCIMSSNNDACVRLFDPSAGFQQLRCSRFDWAVNFSTLSPCGRVVCTVGDDPVGVLADVTSGKEVAKLRGHLDFSFAAGWHPSGHLIATGNQDSTARVWDVRHLAQSVAVLKGRLGAIRSLRFSADGRFLAIAEPADFVHIYDVAAGFRKEQEIDLFGEVSGISFSPDSQSLFVGIADLTYGSLLEYSRARGGRGWGGAEGAAAGAAPKAEAEEDGPDAQDADGGGGGGGGAAVAEV